jgi:hypothetical protein
MPANPDIAAIPKTLKSELLEEAVIRPPRNAK